MAHTPATSRCSARGSPNEDRAPEHYRTSITSLIARPTIRHSRGTVARQLRRIIPFPVEPTGRTPIEGSRLVAIVPARFSTPRRSSVARPDAPGDRERTGFTVDRENIPGARSECPTATRCQRLPCDVSRKITTRRRCACARTA